MRAAPVPVTVPAHKPPVRAAGRGRGTETWAVALSLGAKDMKGEAAGRLPLSRWKTRSASSAMSTGATGRYHSRACEPRRVQPRARRGRVGVNGRRGRGSSMLPLDEYGPVL